MLAGKSSVVGSVVLPVVGSLLGGILGIVLGAVIVWKANERLQPHALKLAEKVSGRTSDDLFYFKNKRRIDQVALNFLRARRRSDRMT